MAKQLKLSDGRNLDYAVAGDTNGFPLVWHHGTPSGYIAIPALADACAKKGFKLITFSRAGYGGSSRRLGRRVLDEVDDVRELLKHLGHEKCVVGGWSGGGPPALACAVALEGCLSVVSVASVAPYDAEGLDWMAGQGEDNVEESEAALKGEPELQRFCEARRPEMVAGTAAELVEMLSTILPEVDKRALLDSDELSVYMQDSTREGLKSSSDGWVDDDLAFMESWKFDIAKVRCPVSVYQGSEDLMCPFAHGQWIASRIPEKLLTKHLEQGEGHISIFLGRVDNMLDELRSAIDGQS